MITINEALQAVLDQRHAYGTEEITLSKSIGRHLAEDIFT